MCVKKCEYIQIAIARAPQVAAAARHAAHTVAACVCADTACATNGGRTPIQGNTPYLDWLDAETQPPKKEL